MYQSVFYRVASEKVMKATANNTKCVLLICIAYTSCDEIVQAVHESCKNNCNGRIEEVDGKNIDDGIGHSVQELSGVQANDLRATRAAHSVMMWLKE
uniref:Uncharacterized protein n=1 Tax=Salix viminalis TaxID=40686 RepID=A0A6N2M9N6_SALVM